MDGWDRFKFEYRAELAMVHLLGVLDSEGDEYTPDELRVVAGNLIGRLHNNVAILDRVRTLPTHIVEETKEDLGLPHPYQIWKVIQDEFQKVTTPHMFQLMAELRAVRMKGSFADFKAQIDLLCVKLATLGYIVRDEEKVCTLLLGLPDDAETRLVTLNIEYRRLGFSAACAELEVHFNRKEGWLKINKKKHGGDVLGYERKTEKESRKALKGYVWSCGKYGHKAKDCRAKKRTGKDKTISIVCYTCQGIGHKSNTCPSKKYAAVMNEHGRGRGRGGYERGGRR